jgi:hypothetical protein
MIKNFISKASFICGVALMIGAVQNVSAHTGITNTILSEANGYSNTLITHGCTVTGPSNPNVSPVVAESVVVPTKNPYVFISTTLGATVTPPTSSPTALNDYTNKSTLANLFHLIQSRDVFSQQIQRWDAPNSGGNVIGWVSTRGNLGQFLYGTTPFRVSAIAFKKTSAISSQNCLRSIKVNLAIADICNINSWPSGQTAPSVPGVNLWIDNDPTSPYYAPLFGAPADQGSNNTIAAASASLNINRDTTVNPYPSNCGSTDPYVDMLIYPSQADVETLQFPGWGNADPTYFY